MAEQSLQLKNDTKSVNGSAILGKLTGPCADIINPTRNGRKYTESLWDKTFKNPIVQEYFNCGGIFGELGHPADRSETDMEKIAICMPEPPKKNDDGQLVGSWDILDTPNGRIAHTLAKYGYKLGISSRGTGDVYTDIDGSEAVDEDTYDFQAFDLVLLPAVKAARLSMTESLNTNAGLKKALTESLNSASPDDRKIMVETLDNLHIDYSQPKVVNNIESDNVADSNGTSIAKQLQESLKEIQSLKRQLAELNATVSVGNTKVEQFESKAEDYKRSISSLTEALKKAKAAEKRHEAIQKSLSKHSKEHKINESKVSKLNEKLTNEKSAKVKLSKELMVKESLIENLRNEVNSLKSQLQDSSISTDEHNKLIESFNKLTEETNSIKSEYEKELKHSNSLIEKYKKVAKTSVNRYIESQALRLGVDSNEVKNKLPENYSFDDIDSVCESLQNYKVTISNLPFNVTTSSQSKPKVTIKESVRPLNTDSRFDDSVDEQLMSLATL